MSLSLLVLIDSEKTARKRHRRVRRNGTELWSPQLPDHQQLRLFLLCIYIRGKRKNYPSHLAKRLAILAVDHSTLWQRCMSQKSSLIRFFHFPPSLRLLHFLNRMYICTARINAMDESQRSILFLLSIPYCSHAVFSNAFATTEHWIINVSMKMLSMHMFTRTKNGEGGVKHAVGYVHYTSFQIIGHKLRTISDHDLRTFSFIHSSCRLEKINSIMVVLATEHAICNRTQAE